MSHTVSRTWALALALTLGSLNAGCGGSSTPLPPLAQIEEIQESTAPNAALIQSSIDALRALLGGPDNGSASGSQGTGRREVDWEVGDANAAPLFLDSDYYNTTSTRGLVASGPPGLQLQASADASNPTNTTPEFGHLNATYPTAFAPFSSARLVSPRNGNTLELRFFVPGSTTPAVVEGAGVVVSDVDVGATSKVAFYDAYGRLLLERAFLATAGNGSLSFLGIKTQGAHIARVVVTLGDAALGPDDVTQGGTTDVVVLDNVIYGEPQATPRGRSPRRPTSTCISSAHSGQRRVTAPGQVEPLLAPAA